MITVADYARFSSLYDQIRMQEAVARRIGKTCNQANKCMDY
jgi:hypothetical protein